MLVRIIKDWSDPDLMRQTPSNSGRWEDFEFTLDPVYNCDYVIVCNRVPYPAKAFCAKRNIWAIIQEPPVPYYHWLRKGFSNFYKIYTPDSDLQSIKYVHSHGALPWHVDKTYDELRSCAVPQKLRNLSWITSSDTKFKGHKTRMRFLERIRNQLEFDLWGQGFMPLEDKWDGLAPYRYSLAIENHSGPFYWTEKLADCFLSWTMPIYYGCTNLEQFFPKESFVSLDVDSPDVISSLNEVIHSDLWKSRLDAISYARELVLQKYQFFPFIAEAIRSEQRLENIRSKKTKLSLKPLPYLGISPTMREKFMTFSKRCARFVRSRI